MKSTSTRTKRKTNVESTKPIKITKQTDAHSLVEELHQMIESGNTFNESFDNKLSELYKKPPMTPNWRDVLLSHITDEDRKLLAKMDEVVHKQEEVISEKCKTQSCEGDAVEGEEEEEENDSADDSDDVEEDEDDSSSIQSVEEANAKPAAKKSKT